MNRICTIIVGTLAAATLTPQTALAQDSAVIAEEQQQTVHSRLYDVIVKAVDLEVAVRQTTVVAVDQLLATDPLLAEVSAEEPDFRKEVISAFYPYMLDMSRRVQADYRPRYITALEDTLSNAEAAMMTEVFESRVGRKLMGGVSRNTTSERSSREALDGGEISRDSIREDNREAAQRSVAELDQQDLQDLAEFAERYPHLLVTFQRLNPVLLDIRVQMDNELPTAEEERLLTANMGAIYSKYGLVMLDE